MFALFSIIYAARMLSRPGMSSDIKQIFIQKHVFYVVAFIIVWSASLASAYYNLYNIKDDDDDELYTLGPRGIYIRTFAKPGEDKNYVLNSVVDKISFIASLMTGLIMALIRTMEPYFLFLIKKTYREYFG